MRLTIESKNVSRAWNLIKCTLHAFSVGVFLLIIIDGVPHGFAGFDENIVAALAMFLPILGAVLFVQNPILDLVLGVMGAFCFLILRDYYAHTEIERAVYHDGDAAAGAVVFYLFATLVCILVEIGLREVRRATSLPRAEHNARDKD